MSKVMRAFLLPSREKVDAAKRRTDEGEPSPDSAFGLTTLSSKGRGEGLTAC